MRHWSIPDPASAGGAADLVEHAFADAFTMLERRISLLLALPFAKLEDIAIRPARAHRKKRAAAG